MLNTSESGQKTVPGDNLPPVLIVEDSPTQAYLMERLVSDLGYKTHVVHNGKKALYALETMKPLLILSDVLMPEMNGIELCLHVKQTTRLSGIPFILVTSLSDPGDILKGLEAGADQFIAKPFDEDFFQNYIITVINQSSSGASQSSDDGASFTYEGVSYQISAGKQKILDLLLSVYDTAKQKNLELLDANQKISDLNSNLEELVDGRTEHLKHTVEELDDKIKELSRAQEALRVSEQKYHLLFEHAGESILILNIDEPLFGRITDCNEEAARMYGYTRAELLKMNIFDLNMTHECHDIRDRIERVRKGGWISYEVSHRKKDGSVIPLEVRAGPILIEGKQYVIKFERDISDRKKVEQFQQSLQEELQSELKETESRYKALFENSSDALFIVDFIGTILDVNTTACIRLEYSREELIGMKVTDLDTVNNARQVSQRIEQIVDTGISLFETEHITRTGKIIAVEINNSVIEYDGNPAILSVARDITERKIVKRALLESEERFRLFADNITDIIYFISLNPDTVLYVNPAFEGILGIPPDEILLDPRRYFDYIHPDDRQENAMVFERLIKGEIPYVEHTYRFIKKTGETIWLHDRIYVIKSEGGIPSQISIISKDITEGRLLEEKQLSDLIEKETLLKEIHHRVRNNMQIISSLLSLQAEKEENPAVKVMLHENINRIRTIALVHQLLYQSKNLKKIHYQEYMRLFANSLLQLYQVDHDRISLILDVGDIEIDIITAVPLGLILNEMVSNSVKYAFPDDRKGIIRIQLLEKYNRYVLKFCDNGVGMADPGILAHPESLGIQMIQGLSKQIKGSLLINEGQGVEYILEFPKQREKDLE